MRKKVPSTRIFVYLTLILMLFMICFTLSGTSVNASGKLQSVTIKFGAVPGAKYYEIKLLTDTKGTGEKEEAEDLVRLDTTTFQKNISRKYKSFQVRAVFSNEVKTSWSIAYQFNQKEEKIDHSKLKATTDIRYKTILQINHPYYYRNNILWVGPNTKISFAPANPSFVSQKDIFYRFRRKNNDTDTPFLTFKKPVILKTIFRNIEESYLIEFYSINNKKIKEPNRAATIFVDTNPPETTFNKTEEYLHWKFFDKSLPVKVSLYIDDSLVVSKSGLNTLKIPIDPALKQSGAPIRLIITDFLKNQAVREFSF